MPSAEERFRAKVVRRRGHDVWTGSLGHRGVGLVRIDGKLRTVQRAAWEFAYGPLPEGARVNTCAGERACVRIEHLSLSPVTLAAPGPTTGARRSKGAGLIRALRPGVWEVTITDGKQPDGRLRRRSTTVTGNRADAERAVAALAAAVRRDLGDLRVRELVGRWLEEQRRAVPRLASNATSASCATSSSPRLATVLPRSCPPKTSSAPCVPCTARSGPTRRDSPSDLYATPIDGRSNSVGATRTQPPASPFGR